MYTSIHLNTGTLQKYTSDNDGEISNLSQINILIGPNNSGKSRFMREIFANTDPEFKISEFDYLSYRENFNEIKDYIHTKMMSISDNIIPRANLDRFNLPIYLGSNSNPVRDSFLLLKSIRRDIENYFESQGPGPVVFPSAVSGISNKILTFETKHKSTIDNSHTEILQRKNIYFPVLRGLRGFSKRTDDDNFFIDTYADRTVKDYFSNTDTEDNKFTIYTGLSLYEDVMRLLLGDSKDREKVRSFEEFLSELFFDNKTISIVPVYGKDVVHVKIGEEEDKPIYELGDGIQAIIILTYPLFFNQGKRMNVHYEEPDMFLHPGFQRIFIETLQRPEFKDFQFFITTHSNHFLDMTLDFDSISIYQFRKKKENEFEITNIQSPNENILAHLGVKNSSVFLSNCTIWVEGISERIYFRKYLELYQKQKKEEETDFKSFKEDVHFSFVEYSGGNITHWSFLESSDEEHDGIDYSKISNRIFLVTDKDSGKDKRHDELEQTLGEEKYYCLKCREIENLLSPDVLRKAIEEYKYKNKEDQEIEFKDFVYYDYKDRPIGEFIKTGMVINYDENITKFISSPENSETSKIRDKAKFTKKAVKHMRTFDDLSDEAKELTEKLYQFIETSNV